MAEAWKLADKSGMAPDPDNRQIWSRGISYAKNELWAVDGDYEGLSIGLVRDGDGWIQRPGWKYEIGWCGQNASFANSLLTDFLINSDSTSLSKALKILDTWTSPKTVLPNGLYITNYDYLLNGDANPSLDACNLGTAALNFFEGADLLRRCGAGDPERLESIALGILDFARSKQGHDGCYARGWKADGTCIYREGTVGAFLIPPMAEAFNRTKDTVYLESAVRAFDYYYGELARDGYTTAGALDTWCIDKESSYPVLQSALMLHDATGNSDYIDAAVAAASYLSTWIWHYKASYPQDSDFSRYGYNTFGATSVSVQHHHLDPYAVKYIPELLRLAKVTGDGTWKEKAKAIWNNGCQLVSDGTLEIHDAVRPEGSQNEAFLHCNWSWDGNPGAARLNDWLVAWPGAFRLEVLRKDKNTSL